jgi:hypothetical protein
MLIAPVTADTALSLSAARSRVRYCDLCPEPHAVLTKEARVRNTVFWDVTTCRLVHRKQRAGSRCLYTTSGVFYPEDEGNNSF